MLFLCTLCVSYVILQLLTVCFFVDFISLCVPHFRPLTPIIPSPLIQLGSVSERLNIQTATDSFRLLKPVSNFLHFFGQHKLHTETTLTLRRDPLRVQSKRLSCTRDLRVSPVVIKTHDVFYRGAEMGCTPRGPKNNMNNINKTQPDSRGSLRWTAGFLVTCKLWTVVGNLWRRVGIIELQTIIQIK